MTSLKSSKRQVCTNCSYPQSTCLCAWVHPIDVPLNIIILQHPKEAKHAKNTVKLLALGVANITVLQGETPEDWEEFVKDVIRQPQDYSVFYPHPHSTSLESVCSQVQKAENFPVNHNVIFIDASWRKALKIWHLNPWLQLCSSWHFANPPKNQYHIRHTTQQSSLSTLESVAYVLEFTHSIDCSSLHTLFLKMQTQCFLQNK
ncbi:tRNA-uridine aminocarboxypropyltransferase [uncultured Paraglaciecola sp.]|uniref:tRNA-uridine aminocarboxypropyltransferase n=1 Tax=uncultured Paraglaciecola sp. TaxID=1765024 RepID=UPI0030D7A5D5|tara:strand:- start:89457 stop:90065 length:609 start_codon:yes stop_codon:yes gene_type:complete